jgi:hypothetical protein
MICLFMFNHASAQAPLPGSSANPDGLAVGGTLRSRVEGWSWFEADSGNNQYAYSGNLLRVSLSQQRAGWGWKAEFAVPLLLVLPEDALAPGVQGTLGLGANYFLANHRSRNAAMIFPKQLYAGFTGLGAGKSHAIRIGRFEFVDGSEVAPKHASLATVKRTRINQRLLGDFGWSHVGRSFDGLHYSSDKPSGNFTFVAAAPTRGVFQADGWGWNKTALGYASFTRSWGRRNYTGESRVLGLYYHDWRRVSKTDNRPAAVRSSDPAAVRIGTFGGHMLHAIDARAGKVDLVLWGVGQIGRWGLQHHGAGAIDAEMGFQPNVLPELKPWVRGGFYWGSGDANPTDNKHGTFFQVLPTPRPFARFPFFNLINNRDWCGILVLRPHDKITVSSEFHALRLSSRNDLWYLGGGVFQPWTFGYVGRNTASSRSLANLYDTSVEYRLNPSIELAGYFGYAQGLAAPAAIYPRGKDGQLGYLEVLYRF